VVAEGLGEGPCQALQAAGLGQGGLAHKQQA
jgi:hypothetical protein